MSFIGVFIALMFIILGNLLEGGHPGALLNLPAFLIVIGGTVGAALAQFPFHVPLATLKRGKWLIFPLRLNLLERSELLQEISSIARKGGFLAIEEKLDGLDDPFLKRGLGLLVDGFDREYITQTMETDIEVEQEDLEHSAKFFEAMGGYAPTIGIIGAVLGLIHAMGLLDKPDELGEGIAVAFVATIYGVAFANLICLPFGNRFKGFAAQIRQFKEMTLVGILSIADGQSPQQIGIRLYSYTGHDDGKKEKS